MMILETKCRSCVETLKRKRATTCVEFKRSNIFFQEFYEQNISTNAKVQLVKSPLKNMECLETNSKPQLLIKANQ